LQKKEGGDRGSFNLGLGGLKGEEKKKKDQREVGREIGLDSYLHASPHYWWEKGGSEKRGRGGRGSPDLLSISWLPQKIEGGGREKGREYSVSVLSFLLYAEGGRKGKGETEKRGEKGGTSPFLN